MLFLKISFIKDNIILWIAASKLGLRKLSSTVAHGVQVFLHRSFNVVDIMGVERCEVNNFRSKYIFYRWVFLFASSISFVSRSWKGGGGGKLRMIFFNGFSSLLLPIVSFLLYSCTTIVHVTLHSFG